MNRKKTLYLVAKNHMDPTWLRAFVNHYDSPGRGGIVRGYSDLEELQILEYMDFAEQYGVKYEIEQSAVVKRFLLRNPDQAERLKKLVNAGLIELAGGGEYVIDYNMPRGESWARSHLYSRLYYKREFDRAPRYAICPDVFGLPAQLPQFMRSLGYDAIILFDRVMLNNKPYWQGLDGTKIVLDSMFLQPQDLRSADCVKIEPCPVCRGAGCPVCEGTGLDPTYNMTRPDKVCEHESYYGNMSADELFEALLQKDRETGVDRSEYYVMITTEETRVGQYLYGPLAEAAPRHGFEIKYLTFEENHDRWLAGQVDTLRKDACPEDRIERRVEGNPVFTGCYASRIEIKKANRELEALLDTGERLAALACLRGGWQSNAVPRRDYPAKKLERLWNSMGLIQFHDAITGTHCNESYTELMQTIRETRRGALSVCGDAADELLRGMSFRGPENTQCVACFNPHTEETDFAELFFPMPAEAEHVEILDAAGNVLPAFDERRTVMRVGTAFRVTVRAKVPPLGCRAFFVRAAAQAALPAPENKRVIENEYYRLEADGTTVTGLFDKRLNRYILCEGTGELRLGLDSGNPYNRAEPESSVRRLKADTLDDLSTAACAQWVFKGHYSAPELGADSLDWTQTVSLRAGEPLVRFTVSCDWQGKNSHLFAAFPLSFDPGRDLMCEVPFGQLARNEFDSDVAKYLPDEWPSLDYAGVTGNGVSVAVFKTGLPGTRLDGSLLRISLLRSVAIDLPDFSGSADCGHHECRYAVGSWAGDFSGGDAAALAAAYSNETFCRMPSARTGEAMPESFSFCPMLTCLPRTLRVSALKRAEDGDGLILRLYETAGQSPVLTLPSAALTHCDTLERPDAQPTASYAFRPFEIASFRIPFKAVR